MNSIRGLERQTPTISDKGLLFWWAHQKLTNKTKNS